MFSDISSLKDKNVLVVKEEVEAINFSHYKDVNEKKSYEGGKKLIIPVYKVG